MVMSIIASFAKKSQKENLAKKTLFIIMNSFAKQDIFDFTLYLHN